MQHLNIGMAGAENLSVARALAGVESLKGPRDVAVISQPPRSEKDFEDLMKTIDPPKKKTVTAEA